MSRYMEIRLSEDERFGFTVHFTQQDTIDGMGRRNIGSKGQRADNGSERDAWNHQCPPTMSDHQGARDPKCVLILFAYSTCFLRRNDTSTSPARRCEQPQTAAQFEV
ncbi:unnamed protein product [Lasius platythorax]|uniref:Uncharacterized protein n=1 Tax=Lasius platythorax TaxID=488582 RepID=A0AAV2NK49_9HYME